MRNRNVGWLIVGISAIIGVIIGIFNYALTKIVATTCTHGPSCTMYDTIKVQTWISASIAILILIIGLFLIFSKEEKQIIFKKEKIKSKKINLEGLDKKEKEAIKLIESENGAIFQSTLMEKLNIGKVGTTRMLDKLEAKQIIERKRRGMNNIVVLKR